MNNCTFYGRIAKDIEINTTQSGMSVAKFSMAISRFKKDDPADFINMIAFNKTAETIAQYFRKGDPILVNSRVQTGSYVNKEGAKVFTTDFIVDKFEFTSARKSENNNTNNDGLVSESFEDGEDLPF